MKQVEKMAADRFIAEAGLENWSSAGSAREADEKIARGVPVLTDDFSVLTQCDSIDLIVEARLVPVSASATGNTLILFSVFWCSKILFAPEMMQ